MQSFILILVFIMNGPIEELLGSNINDIPREVYKLDKKKNSNQQHYILKGAHYSFSSEPINLAVLTTNLNDEILSISTDFNKIIDLNLYNELLEEYGSPDYILKIKNVLKKENEVFEYGTTSISTSGKLEECSFEDNPIFIQWHKPNFKIVLTILRELNKTELSIISSND